MAEIFNNVPGMVTVLDTTDSGSNPFRLTMDGFPQTGTERCHRYRAGYSAARQLSVPAYAPGPGLRLQFR